MIEIKWIYTEFPLTGKDSLLPFIPVETVARAGGQPFDTLAGYKLALYANGDFAGISAITTFTPNIRTNLAWVILEDQLAGANRGNPSLKTGRGEDYALIASLEISPSRGWISSPCTPGSTPMARPAARPGGTWSTAAAAETRCPRNC
jgi:hypothetical protein